MTMESKVGRTAILLAACLLGCTPGCRSLEVGGLDLVSAPLNRSLAVMKSAVSTDTSQHPEAEAGPTSVELARYEQATRLTEEGKHGEAEALLVDLKNQGYARFFDISSRRRKSFAKKIDKDPRLGDTLNPHLLDPGAALREDALFLLAENQFQLKKFAPAQDNFTALMTEFPSTRHIDRATQRLFEIGRYWLDSQHFLAASTIRPAGAIVPAAGSDPSTTQGWLMTMPILPNVTDPTRPLFDTRGRALQALKSIWLNDPTGHLADDALMLTAAIHLEQKNRREADRILTNLRKLYPDSPYLEPAFLLGSHVRLLSYQGSEYDQTPLEESAQLKRSTLGLYPDIKEKSRLESELQDIENARADREWQRVEFYRKKNLPNAMAIHLTQILARFPGTGHAKRAQAMLRQLGPGYASGKWLAREVQSVGNPLAKPISIKTPSGSLNEPVNAKAPFPPKS